MSGHRVHPHDHPISITTAIPLTVLCPPTTGAGRAL